MLSNIKSIGAGQPAGSTKKTDKTDKTNKGGGIFKSELEKVAEKQQDQGQQSPYDEKQEKQEAIEWGQNTLKELDKLRFDILEGKIPASRLTRIAKGDDHIFSLSQDQGLKDIIDEIRLRASVELAKYL